MWRGERPSSVYRLHLHGLMLPLRMLALLSNTMYAPYLSNLVMVATHIAPILGASRASPIHT